MTPPTSFPPNDDADARLDALFALDRGPTPSDLAAARLLLKRAIGREKEPSRVRPRAAPLARLRLTPFLSQAAGFALLLAVLAPLLPRVGPIGPVAAPGGDAVASLASSVRGVADRLERWLPDLPELHLAEALPSKAAVDRALLPIREFGEELPSWWPSLHSDAR